MASEGDTARFDALALRMGELAAEIARTEIEVKEDATSERARTAAAQLFSNMLLEVREETGAEGHLLEATTAAEVATFKDTLGNVKGALTALNESFQTLHAAGHGRHAEACAKMIEAGDRIVVLQ